MVAVVQMASRVLLPRVKCAFWPRSRNRNIAKARPSCERMKTVAVTARVRSY